MAEVPYSGSDKSVYTSDAKWLSIQDQVFPTISQATKTFDTTLIRRRSGRNGLWYYKPVMRIKFPGISFTHKVCPI